MPVELSKDGLTWYIKNSTKIFVYNVGRLYDVHYAYFSGRYEADFDNKAGLDDDPRPVYYEGSKSSRDASPDHDDPTLGMFYYCKTERAWVWSVRAFLDAGAIPKETLERCRYGWLLRSPITEVTTLEEVPTEGWRVWTGVLDYASDLSFSCLECQTNIDCGLNRGICGEDSLCHCHDYATGYFCNQDRPCTHLIGFFSVEGEFGPWTMLEELGEFYDRPVYEFSLNMTWVEKPDDGPGSTLPSSVSSYLMYSGRRWYSFEWPSDIIKLTHKNYDWHVYWSGVSTFGTNWYSEPTDSYLPTGPLKIYSVHETWSVGNYGPFGRQINYNTRFECLSVNCNTSKRVCGDKGECEMGANLTISGKVVKESLGEPLQGGKCYCSPGFQGHFCEFRDDEVGQALLPQISAANSSNDEL